MTASPPDDNSAPLPSHVEEAVQAIAEIHLAHQRDATPAERLTDSIVSLVGKPVFLLYVAIIGAAWIVLSYALPPMGMAFPDAFPFPLLGLSISSVAIFIAVLILATQRRADRLAVLRAHMTLEVALLTEHKTSKIIKLLEELRKDLPNVRNRVDTEAAEMGDKPDHGKVLDVIDGVTNQTAVTDTVHKEHESKGPAPLTHVTVDVSVDLAGDTR